MKKQASLKLRFFVGNDFIRKLDIPRAGDRRAMTIWHLYPTLAHWQGGVVPDDVNPRSHDEDLARSPVSKQIAETLTASPEDFLLANRGATVLAEQLHFDPKTGQVELIIADQENQGLADGATTDTVVGVTQTQSAGGRAFSELAENEMPRNFLQARIHLEVIVGLEDRKRILHLVAGRNTSRQVKTWSLADFSGAFDWIRKVLERDESIYKGRIAYDENAHGRATVLDVLSLLNLFHKEYEEKTPEGFGKTPVVSYSGKGRMDSRLQDPAFKPGFKALQHVLEDVLALHDYVYRGFPVAYKDGFSQHGPKLGSRFGIESREEKGKKPITLPLTGGEATYTIPRGLMFPLLAACRALVTYDKHGLARWKKSPFKFWDINGPRLVTALVEQAEALGGNPNAVGKTGTVYLALYKEAHMCMLEEQTSIIRRKDLEGTPANQVAPSPELAKKGE